MLSTPYFAVYTHSNSFYVCIYIRVLNLGSILDVIHSRFCCVHSQLLVLRLHMYSVPKFRKYIRCYPLLILLCTLTATRVTLHIYSVPKFRKYIRCYPLLILLCTLTATRFTFAYIFGS